MFIQRRRENNSTGMNRYYQVLKDNKMKRVSSELYYQEQNKRAIAGVAIKRTEVYTEYTVVLLDKETA